MGQKSSGMAHPYLCVWWHAPSGDLAVSGVGCCVGSVKFTWCLVILKVFFNLNDSDSVLRDFRHRFQFDS